MKKIIRYLIVILMMAPVAAAAPEWEFAGWYGGGCYPNVEFDPKVEGRVYLASDVAGLWRSDDYGDHWSFATKGLGHLLVAAIAVAPSDSNVVYAATGGGLYVSGDAGASWTKADSASNAIVFDRPASYRPVAVDPRNPKRLCVGTSKGKVFCSQNGGGSWKGLDPDKQVFSEAKAVRAVVFDGEGENLFVGFSRGVGRCQTASGVCEFLASGPTKVTDVVISQEPAIYAAGDRQLWVSRDAGTTWRQTAAVAKGATDRVAVDPVSKNPAIRVVWVNSWDGGVLVSTDGGATWKGQDQNMTADRKGDPTRVWSRSGGRTTAVKIDPHDPRRLIRTDWWGVWRSDDGGTSWTEKITGAPNAVITHLTVAGDTILVAAMDDGLLRSTDGGATYEALFPTSGYDPNRNGHLWRAVLAGDTIVATSSPWEKKINQVVRSADGGRTFELVRQGLPSGRPMKNTMWAEGYPRALTVDPRNPDVIYLGIDGDDNGGLYVSRDRGQTWQASPGQPASRRVFNGLAVDPTDSKRIVWGSSGAGGGAYVSSDGGISFKNNLTQMQWVFDTAIASDGVMYAAGDSGGAKLFVSRNHGTSWSLLKDFGAGRALGTVAVDPSDPAMVAVGTVSWGSQAPCRIFLTRDSGRTWQDVTANLPDGAGASVLSFDPQRHYLYMGRMAGSVYKLKLD